MKNKWFKLFWLVFIIALGAISFRIYQIYKERDAQAKKDATISTDQSVKNNQTSAGASTDSSPTATSDQNNASTDSSSSSSDAGSSNAQTKTTNVTPSVGVNDKNSSDGNMFAHITTEHCDTGCKAFANKLNFLEYCQQVCGLVPIKNVKNCDNKKDLQKDYCNKDLAITKKDASICAKIKDVNIQQTCQNRIAQDIIENQ